MHAANMRVLHHTRTSWPGGRSTGILLHRSRLYQRGRCSQQWVEARACARGGPQPCCSTARAAAGDLEDDSSDDEDWDGNYYEDDNEGGVADLGEAYGPPALVLAGFYLEELGGVRAMLDRAGGEGVAVIPSTPQLLRMPVEQVLRSPEPRWDVPIPLDWVHGGGWGQRRMVLMSGMGLEAQAMVLQLLAESQLGSVLPAVATPQNAGRLLGEVLAEEFKAYRSTPAAEDLPEQQQSFVDKLPSMDQVLRSVRQQEQQQRAGQPQQQQGQQEAQQGQQQQPGLGEEEGENDFGLDPEELKAFMAAAEDGPPPNARGLEDLLAELGGGWEVAEEAAGTAKAAGAGAGAPEPGGGAAPQGRAQPATAAASNGNGAAPAEQMAASPQQQGGDEQEAAAAAAEAAAAGHSAPASAPAAEAVEVEAVEPDFVVAPQQQQPPQQQQQPGAAGQDTEDGWARLAAEVLDAQWAAAEPGGSSSSSSGGGDGLLVSSTRAARGERNIAGGLEEEEEKDALLLEAIDRVAAGEDPFTQQAQQAQQAQQQSQQQRQQRQEQQQEPAPRQPAAPTAALTPGQLFATRQQPQQGGSAPSMPSAPPQQQAGQPRRRLAYGLRRQGGVPPRQAQPVAGAAGGNGARNGAAQAPTPPSGAQAEGEGPAGPASSAAGAGAGDGERRSSSDPQAPDAASTAAAAAAPSTTTSSREASEPLAGGEGSSGGDSDGESEEGLRAYTRKLTQGVSASSEGDDAIPGATTMTKGQLREVADKHGLSYEQLLADAQARGIELPD